MAFGLLINKTTTHLLCDFKWLTLSRSYGKIRRSLALVFFASLSMQKLKL